MLRPWWQYHCFGAETSGIDSNAKLNDAGGKGWELVSLMPLGERGERMAICMKRALP